MRQNNLFNIAGSSLSPEGTCGYFTCFFYFYAGWRK